MLEAGDRASRSPLPPRPARCRSAGCRCSRRSSPRAPCPSSASTCSRARETQTSIHFHYTAGAIPGSSPVPCSGRPGCSAARRGSRRSSAGPQSSLRSSPGSLLGPAARLAARSLRLEARDARSRRHRARSSRGARARGSPGGRPGERDEHARGAPLGAAAHLQLPGAAGGSLGRRRHEAAELPRRRARPKVRSPPTRSSAATRAGTWSAPRTASSSSRGVARSRGDRLRQQVGAERQAEHRRGSVLLDRNERHGPGQIPDREVRRREEDEARGQAEPRTALEAVAGEPREAARADAAAASPRATGPVRRAARADAGARSSSRAQRCRQAGRTQAAIRARSAAVATAATPSAVTPSET